MEITRMTSNVANRLREELNIFLSDFVSTHEIEGIKVELGNCSYDEAMAQYQLKIKVDGVETREQKALKMYAQLDGIDLEKEHPRYKLVEYHPKKRQYPYIYIDKNRPNVRFKGSTAWAKHLFGKVG
tara:strand:+ start:1352 stop:1732 length:381 start_codon:yes stop_codon:yes gene_type:complete